MSRIRTLIANEVLDLRRTIGSISGVSGLTEYPFSDPPPNHSPVSATTLVVNSSAAATCTTGCYRQKIHFQGSSATAAADEHPATVHPLVAFEELSDNRVSVPKDLQLTDLQLLKTQRLLMKARRDANGLIVVPAGALHIHTSRALHDRALLIMQALLTAFGTRGFPFSVSRDGTRVTILDELLGFGIVEETKKVEHRTSFTEQKLIDKGMGWQVAKVDHVRTVALGRQHGTRVQRLGDPSEEGEAPAFGGCHAHSRGFDLHAGLVVPAGQRGRLERVCRYALRPPVTQERLSLTGGGQVLLQFRQPWRDGTTHLAFDPVEFLGRLAVLVPRPRINLILYHGVLAPRAAWRREVVRRETSHDGSDAGVTEAPTARAPEADTLETARRARGQGWAELMRRTFGFDVLACPRCGGRLRLIALIEDAAVIERILGHLGVPTAIPVPRPARAPPFSADILDAAGWDDDAVFSPCS